MSALLEVSNLTKHFGGLTAVNGVSFQVQAGQVAGLIGPNGAGKTTMFSLLSGFLTPSAGSIVFNGKPLKGLKPHQVCALGLTRTFQIVQPFPELTAVENVMIGAYVREAGSAQARRRALAVLERVGMGAKAQVLGKDLTLLEHKRLEIGKALATEPKLLLLDEVAAGLRPSEVDVVLELVRNLNAEGVTLLIVEHLMKVIMNLCQHIVVLDFGQKIAEGTPAEISTNPEVLRAYLGEEVE